MSCLNKMQEVMVFCMWEEGERGIKRLDLTIGSAMPSFHAVNFAWGEHCLQQRMNDPLFTPLETLTGLDFIYCNVHNYAP